MAVPLAKRVRRAVRSVLLCWVATLLGLLPLPAALWVGRLVGRVAWWAAPRERALMREHLAVAFPERSPEARDAIARESLLRLGELAMEVLAARGRGSGLERRVGFAPGSEATLRAALAEGRGAVAAAGHLGNWELLCRRIALVGQPAAVIARTTSVAWANGAVERFRREVGVETFWRDDPRTARRLLALFKAGGILGILIDQDTRVQGVFVPFFGRPAFTPRAAADLALRFRAPLLAVASRRVVPGTDGGPARGVPGTEPGAAEPPGQGSSSAADFLPPSDLQHLVPGTGSGGEARHEVEVVRIPYDPDAADREAEVVRMTAEVVAFQERAIRRSPSEWVWMHRRWKTRPGAAGEPRSKADA